MNPTDRFYSSMQNLAQSAQMCAHTCADALEAASVLIVSTLSDGGKVLVCGVGHQYALAQQFVSYMVHGFERERLPLNAICLTAPNGIIPPSASQADSFESTMSGVQGSAAHLARQVQAYGHAGDVLLCFGQGQTDHTVLHAMDAAHDRQMTVVVIACNATDTILSATQDIDVCLIVQADQLSQALTLQVAIAAALCDAVDLHLLGVEE